MSLYSKAADTVPSLVPRQLLYIHAIQYKLLEDRNQVSLTSDFAISPESGIVGSHSVGRLNGMVRL